MTDEQLTKDQRMFLERLGSGPLSVLDFNYAGMIVINQLIARRLVSRTGNFLRILDMGLDLLGRSRQLALAPEVNAVTPETPEETAQYWRKALDSLYQRFQWLASDYSDLLENRQDDKPTTPDPAPALLDAASDAIERDIAALAKNLRYYAAFPHMDHSRVMRQAADMLLRLKVYVRKGGAE